MANIPPTENEAWGFYGTMTQRDLDAVSAWSLAAAAIANATGCSLDETRAFLDSSDGRHFADDVPNGDLQTGIDAAIARWMDWRISPRHSRESGIPVGLPYLTGHVINAAFAI